MSADVHRHTVDVPRDLDAFAFDEGDRFYLWRPDAGEPVCDAPYTIRDRLFVETVTYEDVGEKPPRDAHRCYELAVRDPETDTQGRVYLSERELKNDPRWRAVDDVDEDGGRA